MYAAQRMPSSPAANPRSGKVEFRRIAGLLQPVAASDPQKADDAERLSELLIATSRGDRAAFGRLYELTSGRLFSIALRMLGRREVAEDAVRDAFVTVWRQAAERRPGRGSPFGWLVTIVRHRVIERLRTDRRAHPARRRRTEIGPPVDTATARAADLLERGCPRAALRDSVHGLPVDHRRAVLAVYAYGLDYDELARELDVPVEVAKRWVRHGLLQLRSRAETRSAD